MNRFRPGFALPVLALTLSLFTTTALGQSRREEREKAEKMARIDAEIARRRAEAPIPDEGTTDMNGVDLHKKRQLEIIQARLGNNTLGDKDKQYEDQTTSGFTVRKWKPGKGHRKEERGYSPPAGGIDPPGEPLVKERKKFFFGQR